MISLRLRNGKTFCRDCGVAGSFVARFLGLMGRAGMDPDEVLLFRTASIHTNFMRFPIDVVFLDGELGVLKIVPALKPWRLAGQRGAGWTLELPAGTCTERGLQVGETLSTDPPGAL